MIRTYTEAKSNAIVTGIICGIPEGTLAMPSHLFIPEPLQGWGSDTHFTHEKTEALCF